MCRHRPLLHVMLGPLIVKEVRYPPSAGETLRFFIEHTNYQRMELTREEAISLRELLRIALQSTTP